MKKGMVALIGFLVIAASIGGFSYWLEASALDRGYDIGYSDGYDTGYTLGRSAGFDSGWSEGYDIGWSEGYTEPRPLQLFESLKELRSWVLEDDTDSMRYVPETFDCDDFAMRLSRNAADDGYFIGLYIENVAIHAKNFAYIEGKTDVIYLIEPQNDWIMPLRVD